MIIGSGVGTGLIYRLRDALSFCTLDESLIFSTPPHEWTRLIKKAASPLERRQSEDSDRAFDAKHN